MLTGVEPVQVGSHAPIDGWVACDPETLEPIVDHPESKICGELPEVITFMRHRAGALSYATTLSIAKDKACDLRRARLEFVGQEDLPPLVRLITPGTRVKTWPPGGDSAEEGEVVSVGPQGAMINHHDTAGAVLIGWGQIDLMLEDDGNLCRWEDRQEESP
jgi:hypothetical protein